MGPAAGVFRGPEAPVTNTTPLSSARVDANFACEVSCRSLSHDRSTTSAPSTSITVSVAGDEVGGLYCNV